MRIVTVVRKPCASLSTTANVVDHQAGALNIDACRVGVGDESRQREEEPSQDRRYTDKGSTNFAALPGPRGGSAKGRWPANLVLAHRPGCRVTGVVTVPGYIINRWTDGSKPFGGGAGHEYETEEQPDEQVPVWTCEDACPVAGLQDGSARFFKQVQDTNMSEIPQELIDYLATMISPPSSCKPVLIVETDLDDYPWEQHEDASVHGMITVGNPEAHMEEIDRVLQPGAHLLVVAPDEDQTGAEGACAVEDFGYEIRDAITIIDELDELHYVSKAPPKERHAGVTPRERVRESDRLFPPDGGDVDELRAELEDSVPPKELAAFESDGLDPEKVPDDVVGQLKRRTVRTRRVVRNDHPTVKSVAIMERLLEDVPQGLVVDPFMGSGTTGLACMLTGHDFAGIEQDAGYLQIADERVRHWDRVHAAWKPADIHSEAPPIEDEAEPEGGVFDMFGGEE